MPAKHLPHAFHGVEPVNLLPAIQQADHFFSAAYRSLAQANGAVNAISALFGPVVGDAVGRPLVDALRTMESLWGAIDSMADKSICEVEPWELRNALRSRDALVHLGWACLTKGCEHAGVLRRLSDDAPACPELHDHRPLYAYTGGEDEEPF